MFEFAFSPVLCFVPGIMSECLKKIIKNQISVVFSLFLLSFFVVLFSFPFLSFTKCFLCSFAVFCAVAE